MKKIIKSSSWLCLRLYQPELHFRIDGAKQWLRGHTNTAPIWETMRPNQNQTLGFSRWFPTAEGSVCLALSVLHPSSLRLQENHGPGCCDGLVLRTWYWKPATPKLLRSCCEVLMGGLAQVSQFPWDTLIPAGCMRKLLSSTLTADCGIQRLPGVVNAIQIKYIHGLNTSDLVHYHQEGSGLQAFWF